MAVAINGRVRNPARGKAQGRNVLRQSCRQAPRRRESTQKPVRLIQQNFTAPNFCSHVPNRAAKLSPAKINRAPEGMDNGRWVGPIRDERSPACGRKPAKGSWMNPRSAARRVGKDSRSPGKAASASV